MNQEVQSIEAVKKSEEIVARIERLPPSFWLVQLRLIVGVATFFDAFEDLAVGIFSQETRERVLEEVSP